MLNTVTLCDECPSCRHGRGPRQANDPIPVACHDCQHILCYNSPYWREGWQDVGK